jgi:hypothetical protein
VALQEGTAMADDPCRDGRTRKVIKAAGDAVEEGDTP